MTGAIPPPKISPAPTTIPMAAEIRPAGADSVAMGPVISATLPRQKNAQTNSATKSGNSAAPMVANHATASAAPMNPTTASGLRPTLSDSPGQPNCPKNPPKPIADVTTPMSLALKWSTFTRYTGTIALSTNTQDIAHKSATMQTMMFGTRRTSSQRPLASVAPISLPPCVSAGSRNTASSSRPTTNPGIATIQNTHRHDGT